MTTAVGALNAILTAVFDLLCRPLETIPPVWALTLISLGAGVLFVWVFGRVSDQPAIRARRDRIRGNLIGARLFRSDVRVVLRLQSRILWDTLGYMQRTAIPMLVLLIPVVLLLGQLNLRFAARPLQLQETAVVKVRVRDASRLAGRLSLEAPAGVVVETQGVRIAAAREVAWRVRATEAGQHVLMVNAGGEAVAKTLIAGADWTAVSRVRTGGSPLAALLSPGEPPLPTLRTIAAVEIAYPPLELVVLGWSVHWLVAFCALSLGFGFALKGLLGVEL